MTKRGKTAAQSGQPVEPVSRHFIHWDTVTRCSQASTTTLELSPLCRQVTDIIQENYRLCRVALYLRQEKSSAFSLQAVSPPATSLDKDTVLPAESFPGLTSLLKERASFFANLSGPNGPASPLVTPAARLRLALPLATPDHILGILDLQAAEESDLTAEDLPYFEALADHVTALIEHARQYEQIATERNRANLLYEVSAALKADLDFEAVADIAVGLADKLGATTGEIHLLDEQGNLFYRSSYAERNKISPEVWTRLVRRTLTEGLDAWVIRNRKPALVHDTLTDKRWLKVGHQDDMPGARSAICAPIIVERRGIRGAISFVHPDPNHFNEQDISMLQALASQIGVALENSSLLTDYSKNLNDARLLLETSQQLAKTHTLNEVYAALLNGLLKTGFDRTTFHLCHDLDPTDVPRTAELLVVSSKEHGTVWTENPERYPLRDTPALHQMVASQEPLVVANIHTDERLSEAETRFWREAGIHSVIVLPLVIRTHTFGFVTLESRTARTFTEHDLNLYQTICHQAISAIQNARQIEFTTEALTSSQALYRAGRILANTINPQKALEDALMEFIYSLGVDQGAIINLSPEGDYGYPIAYIENYEFQPVKGLKFPLNRNSKYLQTLLSGQPVTSADLQKDPDFADFVPFNPERPPQALLSAPILLKGEIIGWIGADAVHEKRYFTQQEVDLARAMADQIAIAIQNHRLIEETRRRAEQFRAVAEVGEAVAGLIDLNEVLTKTVNLIRDRFGFYHVSIFLLDDKQEWAVVRASTGEVGKIMVERPHRLKVGGKSIVGFVTANAQPRIALDVGQDAVHFDNPLLPNTRSEMALPLIYRGTVIGALDVQSTEANAFTDEDVETLQIMADQLASAISNARLFEQLQTGLMEQGILYNIGTRVSATLDLRTAATVPTQETAEALKVAQCTLSLLEEDGQVRLVSDYVRTNRPLRSFQGERVPLSAAPLYQQVLDTQEEVIVHLADLPETETGPEIDYLRQNQGTVLVIAPILLRKKVIGFLEIYDDTPKRRIQPANLTLLDGIALLAANAIHNANLYERTQANLERTRLLYTLSDTLATARKLNETLQIVLGEFLKLLKLKQGGIMLFDKARENGIMQALVVNGKPAEAGQVFPIAEDPIARHIIQHPEPLVIDDVRTHPLTKDTPHLRPANTRGMLLLPLVSNNEVTGFIAADATKEDYTFSQADISLGEAVADQLSIWLENRQLVLETQHRFNLLQTAAEVSRATTSILNPGELIQTSVDLIRDHFDFYYVGLFLVDEAGEWAVLQAGTGEAGRRQVEAGHRLKIGGESMIGWSIANRRARIALDVGEEAVHFRNPYLPDTHSEMALPLISRDRVIGALTVQSTERAAFSDEDITVLQTMADQLANAIANARLFEQMHQAQQIAEQRLYETQALQELSKKLASTLEMDQILDTFFQACTDIVGFEYVMVSLVEKEHNRVRAVAGRGVSEQNIQRANRPLDSTDIMADIIRTGSTEVITGWDDRFDRETFEAEGHADWVRVFTPIVLQNENIGLVEAGYNISTKAEITPAQLDLLRAFIDQMALALDNARRYQAIQRAARREAIITEITGKIRSSISVEDVLKTTVEELGKVTGASRGHILLTIDQPPVSEEPPQSNGTNGSDTASR